jgi:hypothetical protein
MMPRHTRSLKLFPLGLLSITSAQLLLSCTAINHVIYPCSNMLEPNAVERWLKDNAELVQTIEALRPGAIGVSAERVEHCSEKMRLLILYPSESDVPKIKQIIGDRLSDIPYRMQNI